MYKNELIFYEKYIDVKKTIRYDYIDKKRTNKNLIIHKFYSSSSSKRSTKERRYYMNEACCKAVSKATLERLPMYYRYLVELQRSGVKNVSSVIIADDMKLNSIQVRKDLACISSIAGKPKTGFDVDELIKDISIFLGYNNTTDAVIIGIGQLGKTLLSYAGFDNYGLKIIAGFDVNEEICNITINGKKILPMNKLQDFLKRTNVHIGIITVPKEVAQGVCNLLVAAGIKAIWNFAPTHILVPDDVVVKNEDMAASLAILSNKLKERYER